MMIVTVNCEKCANCKMTIFGMKMTCKMWIYYSLQIMRNVIMKIDAMSMKSLFDKLVSCFRKSFFSKIKIGNFFHFFLFQQSQLQINHWAIISHGGGLCILLFFVTFFACKRSSFALLLNNLTQLVSGANSQWMI